MVKNTRYCEQRERVRVWGGIHRVIHATDGMFPSASTRATNINYNMWCAYDRGGKYCDDICIVYSRMVLAVEVVRWSYGDGGGDHTTHGDTMTTTPTQGGTQHIHTQHICTRYVCLCVCVSHLRVMRDVILIARCNDDGEKCLCALICPIIR